MYYVNRGEFGTFVLWDDNRTRDHSPEAVALAAHRFAHPIMIFAAPISLEAADRLGLNMLGAFANGTDVLEHCYIYKFSQDEN
jgi:hypothetical protein